MYGKVFQSMFDGSMAGSGSHIFAVMTYCIAYADEKDHTVRLNPALLSASIGDKPERIQKAIDFLCQPDPHSTTPDEEGRRLLNVAPFTYLVVNHAKYRNTATKEQRRAQSRDLMRLKRARDSEQGILPLSDSPSQEIDTDTDTESLANGMLTSANIDWVKVLNDWNAIAKNRGLKTLKKLTDGRKAKYRARTDQGRKQEEFWQILELELARLADWALGQADRKWVIGFDFIVRSDDTFTKLEEGAYRRTQMKATVTPGTNTNRFKPTMEELAIKAENDAARKKKK